MGWNGLWNREVYKNELKKFSLHSGRTVQLISATWKASFSICHVQKAFAQIYLLKLKQSIKYSIFGIFVLNEMVDRSMVKMNILGANLSYFRLKTVPSSNIRKSCCVVSSYAKYLDIFRSI